MTVTYEDVAVSLGRPITDTLEQEQVNQWIADALVIIGARLGDVSELDQAVLDYVVREAVVLKVMNPEGKQSEQIDDYKYTRFSANARGQVWILDEWWEMLSPTSSTSAFTIVPFSEPGYRIDSLSDLDWS